MLSGSSRRAYRRFVATVATSAIVRTAPTLALQRRASVPMSQSYDASPIEARMRAVSAVAAADGWTVACAAWAADDGYPSLQPCCGAKTVRWSPVTAEASRRKNGGGGKG